MTFFFAFLLLLGCFAPSNRAATELDRADLKAPLVDKNPTFDEVLLFQRSSADLFKTLKDTVLKGCHPNKSFMYRQFFEQNQPHNNAITISAQQNSLNQESTDVAGFLCAAKSPLAFKCATREGFFPYTMNPPEDNTLLVTLNFADTQLFGFYKSGLLAQDELQTLEFPELALVREQLNNENPCLLDARKTSIIIHNVQRFCIFDSQKYINGKTLYGNNFQRARPEELTRATTALKTQQLATILPILAPNACSHPIYTPEIIEYFLKNLIVGFAHAQRFTQTIGKSRLMIHSGGIGSGAFGHNAIVSLFLQLVAAQCVAGTTAAIHDSHDFRIVFYGTPPHRLLAAQTLFDEFRNRLTANNIVSSRSAVETILQILFKYNLTPHSGTGE